ncbi:MAG: polymerase sigma factor, sigma-70 family [Bacteroidetes bacterium]|jgi:RNA polymerase sigma-70 factor (ECF subfamily)|nr:polymerase sigma factor, sigma-70 family [Bacteroidota bacterium]
MSLFGRKKTEPEDDAALVLKYRQTNDLVYIGELYKRYARQVLSVCIFYFKDKDDAKDHVMQIFDKLIGELKERNVDNFKGWLSFVVRNYCISVLRKQKTEKKRLNEYYEQELSVLSEDKEMAINAIHDSELNESLLKESLHELKKEQKECIELFYLQNKSYHEIAALKNYSLNEVKSYIQNGKRNLKILLLEKQKAPKSPHYK